MNTYPTAALNFWKAAQATHAAKHDPTVHIADSIGNRPVRFSFDLSHYEAHAVIMPIHPGK